MSFPLQGLAVAQSFQQGTILATCAVQQGVQMHDGIRVPLHADRHIDLHPADLILQLLQLLGFFRIRILKIFRTRAQHAFELEIGLT